MFILKKGHQPGVYVPLRALFLVVFPFVCSFVCTSRICVKGSQMIYISASTNQKAFIFGP